MHEGNIEPYNLRCGAPPMQMSPQSLLIDGECVCNSFYRASWDSSHWWPSTCLKKLLLPLSKRLLFLQWVCIPRLQQKLTITLICTVKVFHTSFRKAQSLIFVLP